MSTYGLIEREVQTGSDYTADEAYRVASEYISKHKHPRVSIETSLDELSNVTEETFDAYEIGKLCRLALPDYGVVIEEHITHQYDDSSMGLVTYIPFLEEDAIEETSDASFALWPNPSQGRITVEGTGRLTLINTLGQTLLSKDLDGKETIDLPRGIYLVKLGNATKKVVVE